MKLYTLWYYDHEATQMYSIHSSKGGAIKEFQRLRASDPKTPPISGYWRDFGIEVYVLDGERADESVTWEEMDRK